MSPGARPGRHDRARAAAPVLALLTAAPAAFGGLVFRETEDAAADAAGGNVRVVRRVFADGENCKVLIEESGDPQTRPDSYILATGSDAFVIDPARRTMKPVVPAEMQPVTEPPGGETQPAVTADVTVEPELDEAGPTMLGLPTRHYAFRLRIEEHAAGSAPARSEERHELWTTPVPEGELQPVAWQVLRATEDAGRRSAPREVRQAIEPLYQRGLVLRQVVEWHGPGTGDNGRVVREVSGLTREKIPPETFQKPAGLTQTEDLAPRPEEN